MKKYTKDDIKEGMRFREGSSKTVYTISDIDGVYTTITWKTGSNPDSFTLQDAVRFFNIGDWKEEINIYELW